MLCLYEIFFRHLVRARLAKLRRTVSAGRLGFDDSLLADDATVEVAHDERMLLTPQHRVSATHLLAFTRRELVADHAFEDVAEMNRIVIREVQWRDLARLFEPHLVRRNVGAQTNGGGGIRATDARAAFVVPLRAPRLKRAHSGPSIYSAVGPQHVRRVHSRSRLGALLLCITRHEAAPERAQKRWQFLSQVDCRRLFTSASSPC